MSVKVVRINLYSFPGTDEMKTIGMQNHESKVISTGYISRYDWDRRATKEETKE